MNTQSINKQLKRIKCFKGTFPKNRIPKKNYKKFPISFIINTDPDYLPGQHWVALFLENNKAEYMDSFGFKPICCEIQNYLKKYKIKMIKYNTYPLQSISSSTCGAYCILYIKMRCNSFSFKDFLKIFSKNNTRYNDLIATKILKS